MAVRACWLLAWRALLLVGGLIGVAQAQPLLTDDQRAWVAAHREVRVAVQDASLPPLQSFTADGQVSGMLGDYLQRLADRTGLVFRPVKSATLAARDADFRARRVDLLPMVYSGDVIEHEARLTAPYLRLPSVFITRRDVTDYTPNGNPGRLRVAYTTGSAFEQHWRKRHPDARYVPFDTPLEALRGISTGAADIALVSLPLATYLIETQRLGNLVGRAFATDAPSSLAMGVHPDATMLAAIVAKGLDSLSEAEHQRLFEKWMPARHFLQLDATVALTDEELRWLRQHSRVRVAYDREFAPFTFEADHEMRGLGADMLREVSRRLGLELIEQRPGTWAEAFGAARDGRVDVLVAAARSEERGGQFLFVGPWSVSPTALVTPVGQAGPMSLADVGSRALAVQDEHFLIGYLGRRYPAIELRRVTSLHEMLVLVRAGDVAAGLGNMQVLSQMIQRDHPGALTLSGTVPDGDSELYFAVAKDRPELAAVLSKGLAALSDGEKAGLRQTWLAAVYQPGWSPRQVLLTAAPWLLGLALVGATLWRQRQRWRREVLRRRETHKALSLSMQRMEEASLSKSHFIASLSHEIRNPLGGMIAAADLLKRDLKGSPAAARVDTIRRAGEGLLDLLARTLDFSKAESGMLSMEPSWVPVTAWCRRTCAAYEGAALQKGLRLQVRCEAGQGGAPDSEALIDPVRLGQVLANLLSNAIKFSALGTVQVALTVDAAAQRLRLSVRDDGPGIGALDQERIFLPYTQIGGEAAAPHAGGHGLGLALCRQLVEQMGGSIGVHSRPGEGCCFRVDVPAAVRMPPVAGEVATPSGAAAALASPSRAAGSDSAPAFGAVAPGGVWSATELLLIDDDPVGRMIHAELLSTLGWTVREQASAVQALSDWQAHPVGLVLTDCHMPELDGPGFAQRLRALAAQGLQQPCIIALTGAADADMHARCLAAGMDGVLVKPLRTAALQACLRSLAPRHGLVLPDEVAPTVY